MVHIDRLTAAVRARGLRMTDPRRRVLAALAGSQHQTPEQILQVVTDDGGSELPPSTIYRTLQALEEAGVVAHTHLDHGPPTYQLAGPHRHLHLVCRSCKTVSELPSEHAAALVGTIRSETGFRADPTHMAIHGRCARCAGEEDR
ncbi:Fur family transcriptional regulator [Marihabitans asiaticum]|nr:Fur family transcriptional regulator [Marihabitans asiaticum]